MVTSTSCNSIISMTSMNGAIGLQAVHQSQFAAPFKLDEVTAHNWADNLCAQNNGTDWYDTSGKCAGYQSSPTAILVRDIVDLIDCV